MFPFKYLIFGLAFWHFFVSNTEASVRNICDLNGVPMFCNCDEINKDEASYISCFVSTNITIDDPNWDGFLDQKNTKSLVFNSRSDGYLTFVPGRLLRQLPQLQHVLFSEGMIHTLTSMSFSNISSIRSINLQSNGIVDIEPRAFSFLPFLVRLELSDNRISRLTAEIFEAVPSLENLFFENNEITYIDDMAFASLPSLKELDLFNNQIRYLGPNTLKGLESLMRLDMSRNNLSILEDSIFGGTPELRDLDLSQNKLKSISERAFDNLPLLMNLRLKDNRLTRLPGTVFRGAPNILSLLLTDNLLTSFPNDILNTLNNRTEASFAIYIKGNRLDCTCDLSWVVEYSKNSKNVIFREELKTLGCVSDGKTAKINLIEYLTDEDLDCSKGNAATKLNSKTFQLDKTLNDPRSHDKDYKDDSHDDDDDNDDGDDAEDSAEDNDVDDYEDEDFDMDDHSIKVDDDPDTDMDTDEDVDIDVDNDHDIDRDHDHDHDNVPSVSHFSTVSSVKNDHGVLHRKSGNKDDVSLSSKSQPSAMDEEDSQNLDDGPGDGATSLITLKPYLCLLPCMVFFAIR